MSSKLRAVASFAGAILAVVLASAGAAAFAADGPVFHFVEKPGPQHVGLKVVEQYDYSRTFRRATDEFGKPYQGERARPLQTLVWYPAEQSSAKPMTVGDYVNLWATEGSFGHPNMPAKGKEWIAGMTPTLGTPLWAVHDATPGPGRFPVVIYAPGASSQSWENIDLCEYLASYGYVVIASPDMGATTRDMTIDLAGINTQAADISFLIGFARTLPNTDMTAVAVAGHSWGGISNVFAAARDSRIDALIALDGSLRYYPAIVKQAGDVHPEQMTTPMLYFAQGYFSPEDQDRLLTDSQRNGASVLNAWTHGDLITVHMLGLAHAEFSGKWQRSENFWKDYPWLVPADYGRDDGISGYAWMARYTLQFLNAYLKHDAAAMAFLKKTPAENGVPKHVLTASYRAAKGVPASFDGFRTEIGRQGFEHAADIYAAIQKDKSDFKLDEGAVNFWADELVNDNHLTEAIVLLKLNVQMYPESSGAYVSLGDVYALSGQKQLAIESYKRSLEKDPFDADVTKRKIAEISER
jgi:dienelactone hydrolase